MADNDDINNAESFDEDLLVEKYRKAGTAHGADEPLEVQLAELDEAALDHEN